MSQITDWLTKLGACKEAVTFLASATTISGGVASLQRPDWLLWFYFAQSADPNEKKRVLGLLYNVVAPVVATAASTGGPTISVPVNTALTDVRAAMGGTVLDVPTVTAHMTKLMNLPTSSGSVQQSVACAQKFLQLAAAAPGTMSASPASHLAKHWVKLEQDLGTLPKDKTAAPTAAASLRAAISLNNLTGLPT